MLQVYSENPTAVNVSYINATAVIVPCILLINFVIQTLKTTKGCLENKKRVEQVLILHYFRCFALDLVLSLRDVILGFMLSRLLDKLMGIILTTEGTFLQQSCWTMLIIAFIAGRRNRKNTRQLCLES